jgi:hypothetical protein
MHKAKLTYFKESGKYYSAGVIDIDEEHMFKIVDEVKRMLANGVRPGLVDGHSNFHVVVTVPTHEFDHPCLLLNAA